MRNPDPVAILEACRDHIARSGWYCVGVTNPARPFTYTVGLTQTYGHPELVVAGLSPFQGRDALAAAVDWIKEGGAFGDGDETGRVIQNYLARFRAVNLDACIHPFSVSNAYYGRPVPRLQLVWPDADGRFPSDEHCDRQTAAAQMIEQ
jgi:hypothetical protein